MTDKRFEVVMNEFDEVEYIMDKAMMEDRDFAEFIDFVEDVCKENEQLKQSNEDARHILKREFDFATEQRQKHLDDPVVANAYDIIRFDMREALDKLGWLE